MRFVWISAVKDLRRHWRDPFSLAIWLGIPLILAVMMSAIFGGGGAMPQGRLLVADADGTLVSGLLAGAFSREPLGKMVLVEKVAAEEGRARIDRGEGSALLVIPKGMQQAYLRNQPFRLQLFTNPSQRILPKMIEETLSIMVDASFYLQQVAGGQLHAFAADAAPTDQMVAQSGIAVNQLVRKLTRYLNPPLIDVETSVLAEKKKPEAQSFAAVFLPSMIFMSLLFLANGMAGEVWLERERGTLRRVAVTPVSLAAFLAGRLVAVGVVLSGVAVLGLLGMRVLAHMPVANLPAAALWMLSTGMTFFLLLLAPALYASSHRTANMLGMLVIFPLSMVGGCFMPFEMMPEWLARIGRLTPNGWALIQFRAILSGSANGRELFMAAAGLALVGALAFLLAARRMRRAFLV